MSCTVNMLYYRSKTLSNGEHPLMICLSKDGKRRYLSLGVSIHPQHWDSGKDRPRRNCPNKDLIQKLISEKSNLYTEHILEFNFHLDILFSDIDITWLKNYEVWLRNRGLVPNSIGVRFRTLRVIYNRAIEENVVRQEYYPFKAYKVSKLHEETIKRAITKSDLEKIINYQSENGSTQFAIDVFYFSYLCAGINFTDIAYLTRDNLVDNRLVYSRRKTKKLIKVPLQDVAQEITGKYVHANNYLFPVLSDFHKTDIQKMDRIKKVLKRVNKELKAIGEELNLPIKLTTYVARHNKNHYPLINSIL